MYTYIYIYIIYIYIYIYGGTRTRLNSLFVSALIIAFVRAAVCFPCVSHRSPRNTCVVLAFSIRFLCETLIFLAFSKLLRKTNVFNLVSIGSYEKTMFSLCFYSFPSNTNIPLCFPLVPMQHLRFPCLF